LSVFSYFPGVKNALGPHFTRVKESLSRKQFGAKHIKMLRDLLAGPDFKEEEGIKTTMGLVQNVMQIKFLQPLLASFRWGIESDLLMRLNVYSGKNLDHFNEPENRTAYLKNIVTKKDDYKKDLPLKTTIEQYEEMLKLEGNLNNNKKCPDERLKEFRADFTNSETKNLLTSYRHSFWQALFNAVRDLFRSDNKIRYDGNRQHFWEAAGSKLRTDVERVDSQLLVAPTDFYSY